jgi:inosine/xanthosine triphosphate pyrophosphatase family protein
MSPEQKNARSHRALAASELIRQLREAWRLG